LHGLWFLFRFLVVHSWRFSGSVFEEEKTRVVRNRWLFIF
jgi:hypothetical protein